MRIHLIAIGQKMPSWIESGFQEYSTRFPADCRLQLIELPLIKRTPRITVSKIIEQESQNLLKAVPKNSRLIALDVRGKMFSTAQLAEQLTQWQQTGQDIALLIGGPDGLSEACLSHVSSLWSLSPLTFPHPLVRIIVAEQLYRAWSLLKNHPYHRR